MPTVTKPLLCHPIVITGSSHVRVTFSASSLGATTMTASLSAGTYYNHRATGGDSLGTAIITALNAAEVAKFTAPNRGTWTAGDELTRTHSQSLKRTGGNAADVITQIEFLSPTVLSGNLTGWSSNTITPDSGSAGGPWIFKGTYHRGRMWSPHQYHSGPAAGGEYLPERMVRVALSPFDGSSVIDSYSSSTKAKRVLIRLQLVRGVCVWRYLGSDSSFVTTLSGEDGMDTGDPNVALETFWADHASLRPCRYVPDEDTPGTYDEVEVVDAGWLSDLKQFVRERSRSPLLYDVEIPAQEYVA